MAIDPSFFGPVVGGASIFDASYPSAPSSGGESVIGGGAARDVNYTRSFASAQSCMESVLRAMQYLTFLSGPQAASANFVIDTPPVKAGSYWFVHALAVESINGVGQSNANILLMPPSLVAAGLSGSFGNPAKNAVVDGVRIDNQNAVTGGTVSGNPNGLTVARNVVVPPGWFIRFQGFQNLTPGGQYAMKVMFAELPLSFDALELLG
jgi:hypothetical protein